MVCVAGIDGCDDTAGADGIVCTSSGDGRVDVRIGGSIWPNGVKNVSGGTGRGLGL
jgi:hypothetical protein